MSGLLEKLSPVAMALPDAPESYFNESQWKTLLAIMDTVIPSIHSESTTTDKHNQITVSDIEYNTAVDHLKENVVDCPDSESLAEYYNERPSNIPEFKELLNRYLVDFAPLDARQLLGGVLSVLNTRVGALALTGSVTPFAEQPIAARVNILNKWRDSYLAPLNGVHKQMTIIGKNMYIKTSPRFYKLAGFPAAPDHYEPGSHYKYQFLQIPAGQGPEVLETDVIVVGSGCGGGVCAKNLAEAGHQVMVVDKSYYFTPEQLPMTEKVGGIHLFDNGGFISSDDASITVIAGSTWGGGGTINWSASLQTQEFVRKEWARDRGLSFFETAEFQACLDRVCHRMGVSADHIRHNHGNRVILEGSQKLGYSAKSVPQNTGGDEHYCGHCSLGCGAAQKQGPVVSWLPDAANAGAKFMEGFKVQNVIFDESSGTKVAVGVKGTWTSRNSSGGVDGPASVKTVREVIIKAKKVIISAGTLWSPVLLLNSGLKNPQIGRNLYLHPVNVIGSVYKEDVRPWEGGILTTVCNSFENLDGHGHGAKLETTVMLPALFLTLLNWDSGFQFKTAALKFRHMNGFISICRDRDTGRVYRDKVTGNPRIAYTPSAFDRKNIIAGLVAISKLNYVQGATEIHATIDGFAPFIRKPDADASLGVAEPAFAAWIKKLEKADNAFPRGTFACAHQMGSNRMSARPKDGVVDPKGKVWGTEGLYVADASVFPSASGVNPMVTNMAISDWISRGISRELKTKATVEARL